MVGNRQYLSVGGPNVICKHGNIVHELAHALGFYHEHSRPDRDEHITVNWENIQPGYAKNFLKEDLTTVDSRGVAYDFNSVMHYGDDFFSKNKPSLKTIVTKPPGQSIGQRVGLSDLDIKQAKLLYGCNGERKSTVNTPPDIVIATKKDTTKNAKKTTSQSKHLKKAVKQFVENKPKQTKETPLKKGSKRTEITDMQPLADPMIDTEDIGDTSVDSEQTRPLSAREKELMKELHSKGAKLEEISGEENLGKHYFEGDMMLSNEQKQWFDSVMTDSNTANKRALIKNPTYLWKSHTMPYVFHKSVDKIGIEYAKAAMKHWEDKTCLRFPERKKEKDYVMFVFEGGCSSRVGRVGKGMQKINIGSVKNHCKKGNIVHEIGHALGFFHEQSRTDRDKYVKIIKKNVIGWYLNNFHKFDSSFVDERGVPYDYNSIMHYGRTFFSRLSYFLPTIVPLHKTYKDKHIRIGQRAGLSDMDILQGNLLYQCDGKKKLSGKESRRLFRKTQGTFEYHDDQGPCQDRYENEACIKIKANGYCERFPDTMRHACGQTCQLCGTTPTKKEENLFTKLKLDDNDDY